MLLVTCFSAATLGANGPSPWSRGSYAKLAFAADFKSYTWNYPELAAPFTSTLGSLANVSTSITASGTDPFLGPFDELVLPMGAGGAQGSLVVKYFSKSDAFVWARRPLTPDCPAVWPSFSTTNVGNNSRANNTFTSRCMTWSEHYFFGGAIDPRPGKANMTLANCGSGGSPVVVFDILPISIRAGSPTMVIAPLDHFTSQMVQSHRNGGFGVSSQGGTCYGTKRNTRCQLFNTSGILLARRGVTRALRAFGSLARQVHSTKRLRGPGVNQLSYWNDNQAGYSWWTVGPDQKVWGVPEDIYVTLKKRYDEARIPIMGWEPDNNFVVDYKGPLNSSAKNWIGRNLSEFNRDLYPSGGSAFVQALANGAEKPMAMTYYTNGFGPDNAYRNETKWLFPTTTKLHGPEDAHPNASRAFYGEVWGNAVKEFGMEMLFTDFLCYRGPAMGAAYNAAPEVKGNFGGVGALEEAEEKWLRGMTLGAADHGCEVQWCMALASQIMLTLTLPPVTNVRVNGDGGLDVAGGERPALLAATLGLGWSKDNLRTAEKCYVPALFPNGTVKWPCGSINKNEGTSGQFKEQMGQTILATLSLGPVGISDQLSSYPTNKSATITSNVTLVLATVAATGDLLQPSYPLVVVERTLSETTYGGMFANDTKQTTYDVWGTYTSVNTASSSSTSSVNVWYIALMVCGGCKPRGGQIIHGTIYESDLAPMVDSTSLPTPDFADIPTAPFLDMSMNSSTMPVFDTAASGEYVWWRNDFYGTTDCSALEKVVDGAASMGSWNGSATFNYAHVDGGVLMNIAPVFVQPAGSGGKLALLGEAGKVTSISTYRFSSVNVAADGVHVKLRGKSGEAITLLYAQASTAASSDYACASTKIAIGTDGTATAVIPF